MLVGLDHVTPGGAVTEVTTDGSHWTIQSTPNDVSFLLGVAATAASYLAVGADGVVLTERS